MNEEAKTIVNIKIKGGRFYRDVFQTCKIFSLLMIPFLLIGSAQLYYCWDANPDASVLDCIAPRRK